MKLYTEEQIRGAHIKGILKGRAGTTIPSSDLADLYISELTPIELPSDEYIDEVFQPMTELNAFYKDGFINGAKWMKEQILNQNK
jgi:hypothetical protein